MPTLTIDESGMIFGLYKTDHVFHIEKSQTYQQKPTYKLAEFLLYNPEKNELKLFEAKSSAPKPSSSSNFDDFITEITQKLENTLHLWFSIRLNRHQRAHSELTHLHQNINLSTVKIKLLLVINGFETEWLDPIKLSLNQSLKKTTTIWNLGPNPVVVLNHELAKQHGLIQ